MSAPYVNEARHEYIDRIQENYLHIAKTHHRLGNQRAMWLALFYYAMTDDIYGTHWDKLNDQG
jgi:hypothetical protein